MNMLLGLGLKMLSGISSKVSDDRNRKNALKQLESNQKELEEEYKTDIGKSYLDSDEGKNSMMLLGEQKKQQDEALNNDLLRMGATPEAQVAKASELNKNYSNALVNLATVGLKQRSQVDADYKKAVKNINNQKVALEGSKKGLLSYLV